MKQMNGIVSAILPTLNEAENIDGVVAGVLEKAREAALDIEVIVVDDGSTDGTRERVRAWACHYPRVRLLARDGEPCLSSAIHAGAATASGGVVVVMDADLSHSPEALPALARAVLEDECDMAIGSRYVPGGATPGWPIRRRALSRTAAALAGLLVDARDPCSGFFAVRKELLLEAGKSAEGFKMGLEILARSSPDLRVKEMPITFRDRTRGRSKMGTRVILAYLLQLTRLAAGATSRRGWRGLGIVSAAGLLVDLVLLRGILGAGLTLSASQMLSFAASTAGNYLFELEIHFSGSGWRERMRYSGRFAIVALLAFFLRCGMLASIEDSTGAARSLTVVAAVFATAIVSAAGAFFFVRRQRKDAGSSCLSWRAAALGVAAYLLLLRLAYIGKVELIPQEAYYWNYSQHLSLSYLDHPPMVAWLIHLGTSIFGQSEVGVRAGAMAASLVALFFVSRLARDLFGRLNACVTALLFASLPFFFGTGFLMTPDAPLVACWAGSIYFLERALVRGRPHAWLGAGISIGLGILSKYTIMLVGLGALAFIILDRPSRRWLRSPQPYAAAFIALLVSLPVLLWNAQNSWASLRFQGPERWQHAPRFELPALFLNMLVLVTPLGPLGFAWGLGKLKGLSRTRLFGMVFTLLPITVFAISSLRNQTKLNWTGPAWLSALPFMAASVTALAAGTTRPPGRLASLPWKPMILALMLFYGALLHCMAIGLASFALATGPFQMSWHDLGRQVEEIEEGVLERTGSNPLVVGMDKYNLASQLAFYDPKGDGAHETTSRNLFGKRGLMYDFWFPPMEQAGKSLVLVARTPEALDTLAVRRSVVELEPVQEILVRKGGGVVARYFVRVAHGYRNADEDSGEP